MNPNIDITSDEDDAIGEFFESIPEEEFQRMLEQNKQTTVDAEKIKNEEEQQ